MRALPPFDSLVAFEAVLRHGSMTAAAAELGVTQSAVSHRLRRLEAFLGTMLLRRLNPGLAPTPAGETLAQGLTGILDGMAGLRAACQSASPTRRLRVGIGAALAQHWLVRRLPLFRAAHPEIDLELVVLAGSARAENPELDIRILWVPVREGRSSSTQRLLFQEQVFPVCRPKWLTDAAPLADPQQLAGLPLLYKGASGRPGEASEWDWATWFDRLGFAGPPPAGLRFDDIGTAIAAALEGAGVALGRSLLVADAMAEGRLVRPLGPDENMPSSKAHVAAWPAALSGDSRVRAFVDWLAATAAGSAG